MMTIVMFLKHTFGFKEVQAAFNAKYPQAKDVEWELKGDYAVADFIGMVESILHGSIRYRLPGI